VCAGGLARGTIQDVLRGQDGRLEGASTSRRTANSAAPHVPATLKEGKALAGVASELEVHSDGPGTSPSVPEHGASRPASSASRGLEAEPSE